MAFAAEALNISLSKGELKLFKVKEGILILNRPIDQSNTNFPWSIGTYCSLVAKRKPNLLKLGIGYMKGPTEEVRL